MYKKSVFIFRRDLRLEDNRGLIKALENSKEVIPIFILNKNQLTEKNEYKSDNAIQFMKNSLIELNEELVKKNSKLYLFDDEIHNVLKLLFELKIQAVFVNRDYTPFSIARDKKIEELCQKNDVEFVSCDDLLLNPPEIVHKDDLKPYTVFTPFMKKSRLLEVSSCKKNKHDNYSRSKIPSENISILNSLVKDNENILVNGGRKEGLKLIKAVSKLADYKQLRDFPEIKGTSRLSAHNKFGTISIREFYHFVASNFGKNHTLINELYWRDFYTHIAFHFPHVFGQEFNPKYQGMKWSKDKKMFKLWCEGKTGFPIVDAGMRELNTTGYMHNRVRMIVASFLTKDLHIDWRLGEKYFATKLTDYDPCVNNGSWQWAASTGCDAQPYFRIFNPWLQQKKFDPECKYIKKWVPELKNAEPKQIHKLDQQTILGINYSTPIVDHREEKNKTLAYFKQI